MSAASSALRITTVEFTLKSFVMIRYDHHLLVNLRPAIKA